MSRGEDHSQVPNLCLPLGRFHCVQDYLLLAEARIQVQLHVTLRFHLMSQPNCGMTLQVEADIVCVIVDTPSDGDFGPRGHSKGKQKLIEIIFEEDPSILCEILKSSPSPSNPLLPLTHYSNTQDTASLSYSGRTPARTSQLASLLPR